MKTEQYVMNLNDLRKDCAIRQKREIHFILASVIIWFLVDFVNPYGIGFDIVEKSIFHGDVHTPAGFAGMRFLDIT